MKKRFSRRLIAALLTLVMMVSIASATLVSAHAEKPKEIEAAQKVVDALQIARKFFPEESFVGKYAEPILDLITFAFGFTETDPTQEKLDEILKKVEPLSDQMSEMQSHIENFIEIDSTLAPFDNVYQDVKGDFIHDDFNSTLSFKKQIDVIENSTYSDETKRSALSELVGAPSTWIDKGKPIGYFDKFANYLTGSTGIFHDKNIYEAGLEYYKDKCIFGQEALNKMDEEFFQPSYMLYLYGSSKLIVCLEARSQILREQGDEASLLEADLCDAKILSYIQNMANITRKYALSRLNVQPGEFYDRTDASAGTQTILLNREIGNKNFYEEAIEYYSGSQGEADPYTKTGCNRIIKDRVWRWKFKGAFQMYPTYPSEAYVSTTLENAGLSKKQIEAIVDYIRTNFANTMSDGHSLRDFLINCGYNVDSEQNAGAPYLIHKSCDASTSNGTYYNTSAKEKIEVYQLDGPRIPEVTIADYVTCAIAGDDDTVHPMDPVLYFRTATYDRGHLTEAIAMAESMVEDQQNGTVRYTSESFANLNEALEIAKDYENSTNQTEIIEQAAELIDAIYATHVLAPIGDADRDGFVTIMDTTLIQKNLANMPNSELSEDQTYLADVDKNERIETIDATLIQRYLANMNVVLGEPRA